MPQYTVPGADEMTGPVDRYPLPGNEDYRAKILDITENQKPDFNGKIQDVFTVKFDIQSFKDGGALEDINGEPVDSRWIWKDVDPKRLGFKQDGTASIARQFFLSANGIDDLNEKIPSGDTDDLIDREVILSLIVYTGKQDGKRKNRLVAIKPVVTRRTRVRSADMAPAPAVTESSDEYAAAVAALASDEDEPTPAEIAKTKARLAKAGKDDNLPF